MDKIDTSLTLPSNPPDDDYMNMLIRLIEADLSIQKITVLPNWSYDFLMPPTGMVVEMDPNVPFKADIFFTDMWSASSLTRVDAVDETQLDHCQDDVLAACPQKQDEPPSFVTSDKRNWEPSMSDRNATIGLYSANRMNPKTQMIEQTWFIITQTGMDPSTYMQMEKYFLKCEEDGKTLKQVFMNNPVLEQFQALVVRNRRRIIHDFAKSTGITIRSRRYTKGTKPMFIANEEFITMNNYVKFVENESKMLFYINATSTDDVHHGLIFHRAPLQGPVVYVGPAARQGTALFQGNKWVNDINNAFPIGFGKHIKPATWKQFSRIGISEASLSRKLILDSPPKQHNSLLRYFPYRERTKEHRDIEEKLGYTFNNVVPVNPHLVRFV
jgi:hypothetical protein